MKGTGTTVSAVVPVYNREAFLREAVLSLLATGYPALDVVIVDDGSTDGSLGVARQLEGEHPGVVRVCRHPGGRNRGEGPSRNLGARRGRGEYVCFLDSDDFVYPHRFEHCVPLLDRRPDIDGVYEWTRAVFDEDGMHRRGSVRPIVSFECGDPDAVLATYIREGHGWSVNAILLRRACLLRVGGFPALHRCADLATWLKIAASARLVLGTRTPVAAYRLHGGNVSSVSESDSFRDPLRAYRHAYAWSVRHGVADAQKRLLKEALLARLYFCSAAGRRGGAFGAVLSCLLDVGVACPSVCLRRRYWENLALTLLRRPFAP